MNCKLCQKEFEGYLGKRLSEDMRAQVENHLRLCSECSESYRIQSLADIVINQEKELMPDNNLTSRIMSKLANPEEKGYRNITPLGRILRPALIITSMAAAIFAGVLIGNIYQPSDKYMARPVELALIDDVAIESVVVLSNQ